MKNVALVTVTYNAKRNLSFFLPSIVKNFDMLGGIYFVDNASSDDTASDLQIFKQKHEEHVPVHIIVNTHNHGYAHAINLGIQKALDAGFQYICITNNDIMFDEGFFAQMKKDAEENKIDALGVPASINEQDLGLGYMLDLHTYLPKESLSLARAKIREHIANNPLPVIDAPHGGTILFSRYFFENVGLYDRHLFFGGDELDFLYRIAAYNAILEPKIRCAVSLKSFLLIDNLTKHNAGHKLIKARGMLQGNARVYLKHRFTPLEIDLYRAQHALIRGLAKGRLLRYLALYMLALRGLCIEIWRYYGAALSAKTS